MTNLKEIEQTCNKFNNNVLEISKEIKRVQSIKCRLKKQKGLKNYESEMTKILTYEQILKESKQLLDPKEKVVTSYNQEDIEKLDYDETIKAIKSIQSKKANSRWLTQIDGDNDEYKNAVAIEQMLLEHKKVVKPLDNDIYIRKSDLQTIIETIEDNVELSQERILELLNSLM